MGMNLLLFPFPILTLREDQISGYQGRKKFSTAQHYLQNLAALRQQFFFYIL